MGNEIFGMENEVNNQHLKKGLKLKICKGYGTENEFLGTKMEIWRIENEFL